MTVEKSTFFSIRRRISFFSNQRKSFNRYFPYHSDKKNNRIELLKKGETIALFFIHHAFTKSVVFLKQSPGKLLS